MRAAPPACGVSAAFGVRKHRVAPRRGAQCSGCAAPRAAALQQQPLQPAPWLRLTPRWQAPASEALLGRALRAPGLSAAIAPAWRLLLLSDGSVTRHLQILSDAEAQVQVISQERVAGGAGAAVAAESAHPLPEEVSLLEGPLLQRQVWLRAAAPPASPPAAAASAASASSCDAPRAPPAPTLVYACSWWNEAAFGAAMRAADVPIWRNLAASRTEAYRDLRAVVLGDSAALEAEFGQVGPFWGRHYVLYAAGKPLTVVYEVFAPQLARWLGPGDGREGVARPAA